MRLPMMPPFAALPNLRHLRMVQAVGKTGGLISAAKALHASQPAVTQALANLEAELGVRLFHRRARGSYPTADGQRYLRHINGFFDILDSAIAQVLATSPTASRRDVAQAEQRLTGAQLRGLIATGDHALRAQIASQLGLSPTSLTRAARSLERALGTPLLQRSVQGPLLNSTGAFLACECLAAVRELNLANPQHAAAKAPRPALTIGVLPLAPDSVLAHATQRIMAAYPQAKVQIVPGEPHALMAELISRRIDIVFGALPEPLPTRHVSHAVLFQDRYCVVARPGHPFTERRLLTASDLATAQWVVPPAGTPTRLRIDAAFRPTRLRPTFCLETSSPTLSRALLLTADTITLMTRSQAHQDVECGLLVELPCVDFHEVLYSGVTTRTAWVPTQVQGAFLHALRAVAAYPAATAHGLTLTPTLPHLAVQR